MHRIHRLRRVGRHLPSVGALAGVVLGAAAVLSCDSPVGPRQGITVLVTNETCAAGQCDSLEVLAFPSNQPIVPGGLWRLDVGVIATPQACFTLPTSASFLIIGPDRFGVMDTTTITWANSEAVSLGAIPVSSPNVAQALPSTAGFTPAHAAGWSVSLPSGTRAVASSACTP